MAQKTTSKTTHGTSGASGRPNGPTAASVNGRVDAVQQGLDDVRARYKVDVETLTGRLNGHDRSFKVQGKQYDRLDRLVTDIGQRLAQDHNAIFTLNQRTTRLEELIDNGVTINLALSIAGFTADEVKEILSIQTEEGLSNEDLLTGMVGTISWLKANVNVLVDAVAETRGIVNEHTTQIGALQTDVQATATASANANARIDSLATPSWVFSVSAVAGLLAAFVWSAQDFTNKVTASNGQVIDVDNPFANSLWAVALVGVGTACLVAFVLSWFARQQTMTVQADTDANANAFTRGFRRATNRQQQAPAPAAPPVDNNQGTPPVPTQQTQALAGAYVAAGTNNN